MKKLWALLLCLGLLFSCTGAGALSFPPSASEHLLPGENTDFCVSLEVTSLLPYGQEMIDQLNQLLPHLSLSASLSEEGSKVAVLVDGSEAVRFDITQQDTLSLLTSSALPNRELVSSGEAYSALLSGQAADTYHSFNLYEAVSGAGEAAQELLEAITPFAQSKKANYSIKNVGKATWVHLARLTVEQSGEIYDSLCNMLLLGLGESYLSTLEGMSFMKSLTVAVYKTAEDGELMAVYISGKVKHPNGKTYALSYLYATSSKATSYRLELGKGKKGGTGITALIRENTEAGDYSYDSTLNTSFKAEDGKTTWTEKETVQLTGGQKEDTPTLKGEISHSCETSAEKKTTEAEAYTLNLSSKAGRLLGDAEAEWSSGKNTLSSIRLIFAENEETQPTSLPEETPESETVPVAEEGGVSIVILGGEDSSEAPEEGSTPLEYAVGTPPTGMESYAAPSELTRVNLDELSESELSLLQAELFQNTAAQLLSSLFTSVPEGDLGLFSDNADSAAFGALLQSLQAE